MLGRNETALVYLIRHGDTGSKQIAGGSTDIGLSDRGRQQSVALARRTARYELAAVDSSPLIRAFDTATPVAVFHGLDPVQRFEALRERRLGAYFENETDSAAIDAKRDELRHSFWRKPPVERWGIRLFPDMETEVELLSRVTDYLRTREPGTTTLAVSHWDVISSLVLHTTGTLYNPHNTGGVLVEVRKNNISILGMHNLETRLRHYDIATNSYPIAS